MPNHTSSKLIVRGPAAEIDKLVELVKDGAQAFSCHKIVPRPAALSLVSCPVRVVSEEKYAAEIKRRKDNPAVVAVDEVIGLPITAKMQTEFREKYGTDNWYDWDCDNWGSKWDVYNVGEWQWTAKQASLTWSSAWSPVSPVILALSERFPSLTLTLQYADEGGGFLGFETYRDCEMLEQVELNWNSPAGIKLRKELGYYFEDEEVEEPADAEN